MAPANYLNLFPFSYPDELHASQVARLHRDSGNAHTAQTYLDVYGTRPFRITQWIPTHIAQFARKFSGDYGSNILQIVRENTLYPLLQTFGGASLPQGLASDQIDGYLRQLPKRMVGSNRNTRLCVSCLQCDLEEHSSPYLHRAHQVPGVTACWKHKTSLIDACPRCHFPFEPRNDLILAAWAPCPVCGIRMEDASKLMSSADVSAPEIELAQFTYRILQSAPKSLDGDVLVQVYRKEIERRGLLRGTLIDRRAITAELVEHYGADHLARLDRAFARGGSPHWFVMCNAYAVFEVPVARHILLANYLYPEPSRFLEIAKCIAAQPVPEQSNAKPSAPRSVKLRGGQVHKTRTPNGPELRIANDKGQSGMQLVALAQNYRRDKVKHLWANHPRLMKSFIKENPDGLSWLQANLAPNLSSQPLDEWLGKTEAGQKDLAWAKAFLKTASILYASVEKPVRVTRLQILKQSGWGGANYPNPSKMPLATCQLENAIETEWHYWARRIVWAILTADSPPSSDSSIRIRSGVEHHRAFELIDMFRTLPVRQVLSAGRVTQTLETFSIDKRWEGPGSVQTFYRTGRSYERRTTLN